MSKEFFDITLKEPICVGGLDEDDVRALVDALAVTSNDKNFGSIVLSSTGAQVKFQFGPDGSFQGVFAKLDGKNVTLIPGTSSNALGVFKGKPTSTNPGDGWKLEVDLTKTHFGQGNDQNTWTIFYASRTSVLNP